MEKRAPKYKKDPVRSAPLLRIELLGPLCVYIQSAPLPPRAWDRQKTKSLLRLLLTAPGRIFSSEEIIDLLWPALDPDEAAKSLRATVSKLRKVLEPTLSQGRLSRYILTERAGYAFVSSPEISLDTEEVRSALRRGREAQAGEQWEEAIAHYRSALSRFRGPFLADEPESAWISPHREEWRKARRNLLFAVSECDLSLGRYSSAIETCREILETDSCDEEAYQKLMLLHYLSGRLNEAESLFRQCRDALKRELSAPPSEETVRLHDQILRRRVPGVDKSPRSPITPPRTNRAPYSLGRLRFIGREEEAGLLVSHLRSAMNKKGSVVAIGGEPGIGKTRLAEEILVYARSRSCLTAGGRCYSPGLRRPYEPFAEIFRRILKGPGREALLSLSPFWLSCAAQIVPEIPLPQGAPSLPSIPLEQMKQRLYEALTQLLLGLSEKSPLVLLLDDLHWADDESLEILHYLIRQIENERILVIALYRLEDAAANPLLSQLLLSIQRISSRVVSLTHLTKEAIAALFQKMSAKEARAERRDGTRPMMERLALRLHEETHGNPLFVIEALQTWIEKGILKVNHRGKWTTTLPESLEPIAWEIPKGIRQVILSRLERIDPEHRKSLETLSTLSRWFTYDLLEKLLESEGDRSAVVLESLLRLGFLQEDPQIKGAFRFAHENIRQTIHDALSLSRKKELHLRTAGALESFSNPGDATVQELAHHFFLAESWPKAFHYMRGAVEAAQRTFAYGAALSFLDRAEEILSLHGSTFLPPDERVRRRLDLFKLKNHLLDDLGQTKKRETVVAEMIRLARSLGDPVEIAGAILALSALHGSNREWDEALESANQALSLYEDQGEKDGAAKTYREIGYIYWESERFQKAFEANENALRLHEEAGNLKGVAGDLHNLGQLYASMGDYEKGLEYYRKARWAFKKIGERNEEGRTLNILSRIARLTGNRAEALSNTLEALALHRDERDRYSEIHYLLEAASLYLNMGNSENALESYETALQIARKMGGSAKREGYALRGMGIIHEQRGDFDRAAACFSEAAPLLSETGDLAAWAEVCRRLGDLTFDAFHQPEKALHYYQTALSYYRKEGLAEAVLPLLNKIGHAFWSCGKPKEAASFYLGAITLAREKDDRAAEGAALASLGVVYREGGEPAQSLEVTLRALAFARALQDRSAEGYVLSSLSDTYFALGRFKEAETSARAALELRADLDDPKNAARAHDRLGRALYEMGKRSEGRIHLNKARSLAEKSGAADLLDRTRPQKGEPCLSSSLKEPSENSATPKSKRA